MTEEEWLNDIHIGDAEEVLEDMPSESVDMCVTSPPYWGLRDYGEVHPGIRRFKCVLVPIETDTGGLF